MINKKMPAVVQASSELRFNAGIYARLSVDSHNKKNDSIDAQIEIAKGYINVCEDIKLSGCYIDLGKTGTNFHREGFNRLMEDVRVNKINCIIVKDFSRFGREYIEAGNYIEKIFPFLGVRFISVTDHYDSWFIDNENEIFTMNLKNLVNDMYAKDISTRTTAAKRIQQERGSYTGGTPPYGYLAEWREGKNILLPESGTSDIVRKIFRFFVEDRSYNEIITYLFNNNIYRPADYRKTGRIYCEDREQLRQWNRGTIKGMLGNPSYIGTLVQGIGRRRMNKDMNKDMFIIENIHEALIDTKLFTNAAERLKKQAGIYSNIKKTKQAVRIGAYRDRDSYVKNVINEALQIEFSLKGMSREQMIELSLRESKQRQEASNKELMAISKKIEILKNDFSRYYLDYRRGELSKEEFIRLKEEIDSSIIFLNKRQAEIGQMLMEHGTHL